MPSVEPSSISFSTASLDRAPIVASQYDAGVRLAEQLAKGMVAVPIGSELRMAAVASPAFFAKHPAPTKPQDLTGSPNGG